MRANEFYLCRHEHVFTRNGETSSMFSTTCPDVYVNINDVYMECCLRKNKTCVLKVNIHCEGCKTRVKNILRSIEGVYSVNIDIDLGKATVLVGDVDPEVLIKKLRKKGKYAALWGEPQTNNN